MKKTKKSTKLLTKHGVQRFQSRIKNIGDIDSKLKHIIKAGYSLDCFFGDFYKYLYGKNTVNNNIVVYEDNLYIFDKTFNFLITTYPIPEKFIPTRKYFLSTTKKNIIDNISDYINKVIVINYFNKKVTAKLLDMKIMFNNAYFTAITLNGDLLNFSFDDIYDFVLSKNPQTHKYSFQNSALCEALANFYLKKDVIIYINGAYITAKILNKFKINNEIWLRIIRNNSISFINSADIYDVKILDSSIENQISSKKEKTNLFILKEKYYDSTIRINEITTIIKNIKYIAEHFSIYELKGKNVVHSTLGSGKINIFIFDTVVVDFDNGESENFVFPDCFENNLIKLTNVDICSNISSSKIENYSLNLNSEKSKLEKWLNDIYTQIRLEEISFELSNIKSNSEIDCLIDEKEKIEKQLHKINVKTQNSTSNLTKSNIFAITQIDDLKFKNLQEPFINLFLNKEVILFCKERKFRAKILNKLYINKDLWIRVKTSSSSEFIKVSDIYDIKLSLDYITEKDVIYPRLERLNRLKRNINSTTILICELEALVQNLDIIANKLYVLGVKNIPVSSSSFGNGNLSYFIENKMIVDFADGFTKIFTFPYCFYTDVLSLTTSRKKAKITEEQIENAKSSYQNELEYHKNILELTKIKYNIEEINILLLSCEDSMYEKLLKKKCVLEKQYYKKSSFAI